MLPRLALSIWSRDWIGWWCLVPLGLSIVWLFMNPLFFAPPASTKNWASKGVFGERVWTERDRASLPAQSRSPVPNIAQTVQAIGLVPLVYGLWQLEAIAAVTGTLIVQAGKL